jgi:hypothetical protein
MYRIVFSFLLGLIVILMSSLPLALHANGKERRGGAREGRDRDISQQKARITERKDLGIAGRTDRNLRDRRLDRFRDYTNYYGRYGSYYGTYGYPSSAYYGYYGYPSSIYDSYYGNYNYNYPYSLYSNYPTYPNPYVNPYYGGYYYNPGMYNPNTIFVNPPSSMNYPYGYPGYSETYMYR